MAFRLNQFSPEEQSSALADGIRRARADKEKVAHFGLRAGSPVKTPETFASPEVAQNMGLMGDFGQMAFSPGVKEFADRYFAGRFGDTAQEEPNQQEVA